MKSLPTVVLAVVLASQTTAQTPFFDLHGTSRDDNFGRSMDALGDINGDGLSDFVVGAHRPGFSGGSKNGSVFVYSGIGGELLYRIDGQGPFNNDRFGTSVAAVGDVDGDGTTDFMVGAPGRDFSGDGFAFVYSGATGAELYNFALFLPSRFAWSVAHAGDVNRDGSRDFVVGIPWADTINGNDSGEVRVYSGADGSVIWVFQGFAAGDQFGASVGGNGRIDPDGHEDIIVGAPFNDAGGVDAGAVYCFSGFDRSLIHEWRGNAGDELGSSVSNATDVDGDWAAEVVIGARNAGPEGSAYLYNGANGLLRFTFTGWQVTELGDYDGDTVSDLLVGSDAGSGEARVYSGASGLLLDQISGQGNEIGAAGDLNGDGFADVLTADTTDNESRGIVRAWLGGPGEPGTPLCFGDGAQGPCPCSAGLILSEDFNSGVTPPGWTMSGPWQVTDQCAGCGDSSPYLYFGFPAQCSYNSTDILSGTVTAPAFLVGQPGTLTVDFCHNLQMEPDYEQAWFRVSRSVSEDLEFFVAPWAIPLLTPPFEIPVQAGETIQLSWFFTTNDSLFNNYPGWHIDDVTVIWNSNFADVGEGCMNSTGEGGRLTAIGSTSVGADDLTLFGTQLAANQSAIYFVGDTQWFPGIVLESGLICTGGNARRYPGINTGPAGFTTLTTPVADSLGLIQAGGTYTFQLFYRDLYPESPCGGIANTTNAYEVTFGP